MASGLHEALIALFQHRPELAAELLDTAFGMPVPAYEDVRLESGELTDLRPTEYRADAVVVLVAKNRPVLGVIVEAQLRPDADKHWSWPVYLTTLRARLRCAAVLLVVCADSTTTSWCRAPVRLGPPGCTLTPLVLGPDQVPVITDVEQARRSPELAVLSAMAHGADPDHEEILHALLAGLELVDAQHATLYHDLVFAALPVATRRYLEKLMTAGTYEYQSEFVRKFVFQGRAEGRAEAILTVLAARGIDIPDHVRSRICECDDLDQLEIWLRRAAVVTTAEELFD